jgi:hypothetical protein
MSVTLSVAHVSANVAAHVTTRLPLFQPQSAPAANGCELRNGLAKAGDGIIAQATNAIPLLVKWFLVIAAVVMVVLAFTNVLPKVGKIVIGVIGGAIFLAIAPSMSGVIAPDKCA